MKQGNNRRSRSRGGGKRHGGGKGHNFESSGSEMKMRGSAQQLHEKYLALARDASSAGDRIAAESYFQYADHYHRILNADGGNGAGRPQQQHQQHQQHPQQHRGGPDQRHDQRSSGNPHGGGPQPVVPAAAMAAVATQASPDGKTSDAAKTTNPATGRGQGPTAS
jgi:hypothetical protein